MSPGPGGRTSRKKKSRSCSTAEAPERPGRQRADRARAPLRAFLPPLFSYRNPDIGRDVLGLAIVAGVVSDSWFFTGILIIHGKLMAV